MKKLLLLMSVSLLGAACGGSKPQSDPIDNRLTEAEIAAGVMTPEVMWKMNRLSLGGLSPDGQKVLYTVTQYDMAANAGTTSVWVRDLAGKTETRLGEGSAPAWSADGKTVYFLQDDQLCKVSADGGKSQKITQIEGGIEAFGVSPDGTNLWWVATVHAEGVQMRSADKYADMPLSKARLYDDLMVRHWDYWDQGNYRHIFTAPLTAHVTEGVDILGAKSAWDAPLAPYFDATEITWSPDGREIAYTCKPLTGTAYALSTDSDIFLYSIAEKTTRNICKESGADHLPGYDKYPVYSPDGQKIAFQSQRRAGNEADKSRLFVWDRATREFTDATADFDYNAANVLWKNNSELYFIAPIEATHQLCEVSLGGPVRVVTKGDHDIHAVSLANGVAIADIYTMSRPSELYTIALNTGEITRQTGVNDDIFAHIKMGEVQKRWVKTTDGKQMLVWVILPPNFDASKKYPTLLYCEGGPQSVVSQFWSYRWNFQLMAAQGYVVVAPNRRGLPSFGQEWLDQISGDYSGQNIQDYLSAIDDVAREPWCDTEHLGCVGASYGGYSVYYLAGHHNKRFKAFISHCGIFDFDAMYGSTEELFFVTNDYGGSYWDKNPTAQRSYAHSPHKFVEKWDTPILIFTGERDYRIPYTQSLEAFTAARVRGIDARLVSFENENHQVFQPQNSIVWNREFFGWLDKYLKNN